MDASHSCNSNPGANVIRPQFSKSEKLPESTLSQPTAVLKPASAQFAGRGTPSRRDRPLKKKVETMQTCSQADYGLFPQAATFHFFYCISENPLRQCVPKRRIFSQPNPVCLSLAVLQSHKHRNTGQKRPFMQECPQHRAIMRSAVVLKTSKTLRYHDLEITSSSAAPASE